MQFVEPRHLGGAPGRPADHAVGNRNARHALGTVAFGTPGELAVQGAYAGQPPARVRPWSTDGRRLNFLAAHHSSVPDVWDVRASYDADAYRPLREVERRYDPRNLFRLNHTIPPSEATK
ncbi:BBE domain-containing protein [Streptomyces sp. NPDC088261]|uniref:BBE domain-containing protein n=1 Tax=Streptomyces sp. NPDC088261 TaxID=3365851 RepID=UPI0038045C78